MSSESPKRPAVPQDMKAFNAKLIEEFRANDGKLSGPLEGRVLMLLTTTGARTRSEHTVVVGFKPRLGIAGVALCSIIGKIWRARHS